jgi:hypothetical protein
VTFLTKNRAVPDTPLENPLSTDKLYKLFAKTTSPITFGMLLSGLYHSVVAYFKAINEVISSINVYLLLIPIIIWLTTYFDISAAWYALPLTEKISLFSLLLIVIFLKNNKIKKHIKLENAA